MNKKEPFLYNHYSKYIKDTFGERVQKITVDGGFTCPNRDGTVGIGGCTFCNNESFSPAVNYKHLSITEQIENSINFLKKRYNTKRYIAYFQSYTNTYSDLTTLKNLYEEALAHPDVIGLSIGTRPDCVDNEKLDYIQTLAKKNFVTIEYGIESFENSTLQNINRGHGIETAISAIEQTAKRNINICAHLIIGLPGETKETWINAAEKLSALPINFLKLHNLEIINGTELKKSYIKDPFPLLTLEEYIDIAISFLEKLNPNIIIERLFDHSPGAMRHAPHWNTNYTDCINLLKKEMKKRNSYQSRLFTS